MVNKTKGSVRRAVPDTPGVYRMRSPTGEVVYVGKAKRLRNRILSYFRAQWPHDKQARILKATEWIEWEESGSEFAAHLSELRDIKRFRPRLNVAMKRDGRNYCFVRLVAGPAPRLLVARTPGAAEDGGVSWGPYFGAGRVRAAVRVLNDHLGLRDCRLDHPVVYADQPDLLTLPARAPGCLRHALGTCAGPCVAAVSASDYLARVRAARAFLDGRDDAPITAITRAMAKASEALAFERAAALRDRAAALDDLDAQRTRLQFTLETLSFVYRVPDVRGGEQTYVIRRGRVRAAFAAAGPADRLADAVARAREEPPPRGNALPAHEVDEVLLVTSWFKRFPAELERTTPF